VTALSAAEHHVGVLTANGGLLTFGSNEYLALGQPPAWHTSAYANSNLALDIYLVLYSVCVFVFGKPYNCVFGMPYNRILRFSRFS
jgi:hypothetical protein